MRCTFKLTRGRYIFTFLLILPRLIGEGDWGKRIFFFLDIYFFKSPPLVSLPCDPSDAECHWWGRLFWLTAVPCYHSPFFKRCWRWQIDFLASSSTWQHMAGICVPIFICVCATSIERGMFVENSCHFQICTSGPSRASQTSKPRTKWRLSLWPPVNHLTTEVSTGFNTLYPPLEWKCHWEISCPEAIAFTRSVVFTRRVKCHFTFAFFFF